MHQWLSASPLLPFYLGFYGYPISRRNEESDTAVDPAFTSQKEVTILAFGDAGISINQQRHGKGISTFAVQKP